jgi:hypothetical protein
MAKKIIWLLLSHLAALIAGFAIGIYVLPILTAPEAPTASEVGAHAAQASFKGRFRRDLKDSDALHWGEGELAVGPKVIALAGEVAPGPAYKLYLSPEFVETEADFQRLKPQMLRVGDVKTFKNFVVPLPEPVELERYNTVIVWCESFNQFISAAKYR